MNPHRATSHSTISLRRFLVDDFHRRHVPRIPMGSRVLDLGGNKIAKRGTFNIEQHNLRVVYANLSTAKCPDTQADAAALPFTDTCFDAVICSELLEHVPDPLVVLGESYRVLRDAGTLLICVPFLYRIHGDPYDFGRYTDHYWRQHLQVLGFDRVTIEHQGLFFAVLADFLTQYVYHIRLRRPFGRLSQWAAIQVQQWALRYEQQLWVLNDPFLRSFSTGFGIVAQKAETR